MFMFMLCCCCVCWMNEKGYATLYVHPVHLVAAIGVCQLPVFTSLLSPFLFYFFYVHQQQQGLACSSLFADIIHIVLFLFSTLCSFLLSFLFSLFSFPSLPFLAFLFIIQFIKLAQNVLPRQSSLLRLAFLLIFSPQTLRPFSLPFFLYSLYSFYIPRLPSFLFFCTFSPTNSPTRQPPAHSFHHSCPTPYPGRYPRPTPPRIQLQQ